MTEGMRKMLIGAVKGSISSDNARDLLTGLFKYAEISDDFDAQIDILISAMGNPKVGFCGQPTPQDKYETLLNIYLSGTWQEFPEEV
jgi:hypothetical protein